MTTLNLDAITDTDESPEQGLRRLDECGRALVAAVAAEINRNLRHFLARLEAAIAPRDV